MNGWVTGGVNVVLRLEGLCALIAATLAYSRLGNGWGCFALFFLAPDLSFAGYLAGSRFGAIAYNIAHSWIGAIGLLTAGIFLTMPIALSAGLIRSAHIVFDRALGYGLECTAGFGYTHLGRIGNAAPRS